MTTLERLESTGQSTKRISIKIIGGLVKNDEVGTLPCRSGKTDLDTLTTRETLHVRMRDKLSVETKLSTVGLNFLTDEVTKLTSLDRLGTMDLSNHLGV